MLQTMFMMMQKKLSISLGKRRFDNLNEFFPTRDWIRMENLFQASLILKADGLGSTPRPSR